MSRTYYFDLADGRPVRDRVGLQFEMVSGAIEHSKDMARQLRSDTHPSHPALSIIVLDQDGREVHREPVYPTDTDCEPSERLSRQ